MSFSTESIEDTPPPLVQRVVGFGTIMLGAFALYYCVSFIGDVWNTPTRSMAIGATVSSVVIILFGIAIGFPEFLPRKAVSVIMLVFGFVTAAIGLSIAAWVAFNLLVARQPAFRAGNSPIAAMVITGCGIAWRCYSKLKQNSD